MWKEEIYEMGKNFLHTIFVFSFCIVCLFCFGQNNDAAKLIGKKWKLFAFVNVEDNQYEIVELPYKPTIEFYNNGEFGGYDGCNTFGMGKYQTKQDSITISTDRNTESTKIYCVETHRKEIEDKYNTFLRKAIKFTIKQDSLNLFYGENGKMIFY